MKFCATVAAAPLAKKWAPPVSLCWWPLCLSLCAPPTRITARRQCGERSSGAGECDHFCWPGLPHMWAEMMLRMIEQSTYGFSDGLH